MTTMHRTFILGLVAALCACGTVQDDSDAGNTPIDAGAIEADSGITRLLVVEPADADFGTILVGQGSAEATLVVRNDGNVGTGTIAVQRGGANIAEFTVLSDDCNGQILAAGGVCEITVKLEPTTEGSKVGALIVGDGVVRAEASLRGVALAPGALSIAPSTHQYSALAVGESEVAMFVVTNTGGVITGAITAALEAGGPGQTHYSVSSDGCSAQMLGAGASCSIEVRFAPTTSGTLLNSLTVSATPGDTAIASLSGSGAFPPTTLSVNTVNLGGGGGRVTSTPLGINCGLDCTEVYPYGTMVTLTAKDGTSAVFEAWSGACTGSAPTCVVTMTAARMVTAIFNCGSGGGFCL